MSVTRRAFLGYATAAAAAGTLARWPLGKRSRDRAVIVLGEYCRNPESLAGYESAVGSASATPNPLVILPAVTTVPDVVGRLLHQLLDGGATIVLESGAGFL